MAWLIEIAPGKPALWKYPWNMRWYSVSMAWLIEIAPGKPALWKYSMEYEVVFSEYGLAH